MHEDCWLWPYRSYNEYSDRQLHCVQVTASRELRRLFFTGFLSGCNCACNDGIGHVEPKTLKHLCKVPWSKTLHSVEAR